MVCRLLAPDATMKVLQALFEGGRKVAKANERFGEVALTKIAYAWGSSDAA